ncbi:OmpA family protein [Burkholderia pyrrocinia]
MFTMKRALWTSTLLLLAGVLTGCGAWGPTSQGPTYNVYDAKLPNGEKAYQVMCYGLFQGPGACQKQAAEICQGQPVRSLEQALGLASNARELVFQCGAQQVAAAPEATPVPPPKPRPAPEVLTLSGDANFQTDKATLNAEARAKLDHLIAQSKGQVFDTVTVKGYTDSVGSARYNQSLSERRAQSVANYLKTKGLRAKQFEVQGFGKSNPVASNATASGRAQNRRVEIVVN